MDHDIRPARADELSAVAELRWRWWQENGSTAEVSRAEFVEAFTAWSRENPRTHRCLVVVRDDSVIGMAWLAITQRVPHPGALERASGDLQCVYVLPEERDGGVGGRLIEAVLGCCRELGLERAVVHSSDRAITAYTRHGFAGSPKLLQTHVSSPR